MNLKVDEYINKHVLFSKKLSELRKIILSTKLEETIKWNFPVYTLNNKNILSIGAFKNHIGIWFFQGALLKDEHHVLQNAQEKTKAMRQWRFDNDSKIENELLLSYIEEAIINEKKSLKIKPTKKPLVIPQELKQVFRENSNLSNIFDALTLSKKREFADYISEAKREATKVKRIEKIVPMIINNIGLHDKYKNC